MWMVVFVCLLVCLGGGDGMGMWDGYTHTRHTHGTHTHGTHTHTPVLQTEISVGSWPGEVHHLCGLVEGCVRAVRVEEGDGICGAVAVRGGCGVPQNSHQFSP